MFDFSIFFAGYTCIQLIDEAYPAITLSTTKIVDGSTTIRRIVPLHIRNESFDYLESSDIIIENEDTFYSKLRGICEEMQSLRFDRENQLVDEIVELASSSSSCSLSTSTTGLDTPYEMSNSTTAATTTKKDDSIRMTTHCTHMLL